MKKKIITIDDLAGMVKRGFDETAKKRDVDLLKLVQIPHQLLGAVFRFRIN